MFQISVPTRREELGKLHGVRLSARLLMGAAALQLVEKAHTWVHDTTLETYDEACHQLQAECPRCYQLWTQGDAQGLVAMALRLAPILSANHDECPKEAVAVGSA